MKTLRAVKVGDTAKVVKLHGEGAVKTTDYGHGDNQRSRRSGPQSGPPGRSH